MQELKEQLLQKIKSGEVAMRPRWHFVLKTLLAMSGMFILLLGLVYLLSFIAFALRESGVLFTPLLGSRGMFSFMMAAPWLLVLLVFVFVVSLEILVRTYSFVYRRPLLYSVLGVVVVSLFGSVLIMQTSLHARIHEAAVLNHMPMVMPLYERYAGDRPDDMYVGVIMGTSSEAIFLSSPNGDQLTVSIDEKTKLPRGKALQLGDRVMLIGEQDESGGVRAFGVRRYDEERNGQGHVHIDEVRERTRN